MPPRRKTVRVRRPKRKTRTRSKSKSKTTVSRHAAPVTDAMVTQLHYAKYSTPVLTGSASIFPVDMFQTSLFDPDASLGGHQPMWFDQVCPSMYTSYIVMGFWYNITIVARTNVDALWTVYVRHANTTVLDSSPQNALERIGTMTKFGTPQGGSKSTVTMKGYLSTAKIRGLTMEKIRTDPQYEGTSIVNPAAMGYLHIGLYTPSGSTMSFDVVSKLRYNVRFTGKVTPGGS